MSTLDQLRAFAEELEKPVEPLLPPGRGKHSAAAIEAQNAIRKLVAAQVADRIAKVTAGLPDPVDGSVPLPVLPHPPRATG